MHNKSWQDLIPFYVAGTLPADTAAALEAHLTGCTQCQQAVETWQHIAALVRADVEARIAGYSLPSLRLPRPALSRNGSHRKEFEMIATNRPRPRRVAETRLPTMPLLAAALLVVLLAGTLLLATQPGDSNQQPFGVSFIEISPTPLPDDMRLDGITPVLQSWNNSGPAALSMVMSYYGQEYTQDNIAGWLKPDVEDKSVTPWQIVAFMTHQTDMAALYRVGGTTALLRQLVAGGYPVIIETGMELDAGEWSGHHWVIMGYDDTRQEFLVYDPFLGHGNGQGRAIPYSTLENGWQAFNYRFIIIYPPAQESQLAELLGRYADPAQAAQIALGMAQDALSTNPDNMWAMFNLGSSYAALGDYENAVVAYDQALEQDLPYRMLWYQFGPFEAFFHTGDYDQVLTLANTVAETTPYVEQIYYWRAMVYAAQGERTQARIALDEIVARNPSFFVSEIATQQRTLNGATTIPLTIEE